MKTECDEIRDFDQQCQIAWGAPWRSLKQLGNCHQIRNMVDFAEISDVLKIHIAEKLILESCSTIGRLIDSGDVWWYMHNFARDFRGDHDVFSGRRVPPLKAALLLAVNSGVPPHIDLDAEELHQIVIGGAPLAALYLLSQLEYVLRKKCRYLDDDGKVTTGVPPQLMRKLGKMKGRGKIVTGHTRVNGINEAFTFYLYRNATPLARRLRYLERRISISGRLKRIRHPAMHGLLGDAAAEGSFYVMLFSMFYYAERQVRC